MNCDKTLNLGSPISNILREKNFTAVSRHVEVKITPTDLQTHFSLYFNESMQFRDVKAIPTVITVHIMMKLNTHVYISQHTWFTKTDKNKLSMKYKMRSLRFLGQYPTYRGFSFVKS